MKSWQTYPQKTWIGSIWRGCTRSLETRCIYMCAAEWRHRLIVHRWIRGGLAHSPSGYNNQGGRSNSISCTHWLHPYLDQGKVLPLLWVWEILSMAMFMAIIHIHLGLNLAFHRYQWSTNNVLSVLTRWIFRSVWKWVKCEYKRLHFL